MMESWIIDQLNASGVEHFCIAPGSRSTPLVNACIALGVKTHVHFDERGLGFFALKLIQASHKPTCIIVTSGTALGNLLPSIMEAYHAKEPLIILSADRPFSLLNTGANQTTRQNGIFAPFTKQCIDLPIESEEKVIRSTIENAVFQALSIQTGPVHINCPLDEPLFRTPAQISPAPKKTIKRSRIQAPPYKTEHSRGLILIGKLPHPDDVLAPLELAEKLLWPIVADIVSNARLYPTLEQMHYFDFKPMPKADFILHFGETLTSKRVLQYCKESKAQMVHISPWPDLVDPLRLRPEKIQSDILEFCRTFEGVSDPDWIEQWVDQEPMIPQNGYFSEVHLMKELSKLDWSSFSIFLGNGMPIRDANHFLFPEECKGFYGNRGLSGIDGNIASIAALANKTPTLGIIGDQAALHDLNSLPLLKKTPYPAHLLILNNFGGGIFHHLPVKTSPHFETFWAASHNFSFQQAAEMFDIPFHSFDTLKRALKSNQSSLIELQTDPALNTHYSCL